MWLINSLWALIKVLSSSPSPTSLFCRPDIPIVALPGVDDSYPPQKKSFMLVKYLHDFGRSLKCSVLFSVANNLVGKKEPFYCHLRFTCRTSLCRIFTSYNLNCALNLHTVMLSSSLLLYFSVNMKLKMFQ